MLDTPQVSTIGTIEIFKQEDNRFSIQAAGFYMQQAIRQLQLETKDLSDQAARFIVEKIRERAIALAERDDLRERLNGNTGPTSRSDLDSPFGGGWYLRGKVTD